MVFFGELLHSSPIMHHGLMHKPWQNAKSMIFLSMPPARSPYPCHAVASPFAGSITPVQGQ